MKILGGLGRVWAEKIVFLLFFFSFYASNIFVSEAGEFFYNFILDKNTFARKFFIRFARKFFFNFWTDIGKFPISGEGGGQNLPHSI